MMWWGGFADLREHGGVGHLGTLDPMATGVLPLVIGKATRLAQFFQGNQKVYEGVIRFGNSTDTYDRQGAPTSDAIEPAITWSDWKRARVLARHV